MRISSTVEPLLWSLIRAAMRSPAPLRLAADAVAKALTPPGPRTASASAQLELWHVDADGLPLRPWRISADARFDCAKLGCRGMSVKACVARQLATDRQRTTQTSRGQGTDYPSCDSSTCAQGRGLREALEPAAGVEWRGQGPGGRLARGRSGSDVAAQMRAKQKAQRDDEVPSFEKEEVE